jgi:hypothetical protein
MGGSWLGLLGWGKAGGLKDGAGDLSGVWFGAHGGPNITLDRQNINRLSL